MANKPWSQVNLQLNTVRKQLVVVYRKNKNLFGEYESDGQRCEVPISDPRGLTKGILNTEFVAEIENKKIIAIVTDSDYHYNNLPVWD